MGLIELLYNLINARNMQIAKNDEDSLKLRKTHIQNIYGQILRCNSIKVIYVDKINLYVDRYYIYWNNGNGLMVYKTYFENYSSIFLYNNCFHVVHNAILYNNTMKYYNCTNCNDCKIS